MKIIENKKLLIIKGFLFLLVGILASALLLLEIFSWKRFLLLTLIIWAFCRFYYFMFYVIEKYVDEIVTVTEEEIALGIYHCVQNNRLVVEGAGAAGVAALLAKKIKVKPDDTVCAVLCGGNIDANLLSRVLEQVLVRQGRYIMLKLLVPDRSGMLAVLAGRTGWSDPQSGCGAAW